MELDKSDHSQDRAAKKQRKGKGPNKENNLPESSRQLQVCTYSYPLEHFFCSPRYKTVVHVHLRC